MLRALVAAVMCLALPYAGLAHEFWISPQKMVLAQDDVLEPVLMIGEFPQSESYPFQPQAYATARWGTGGQQIDLTRLPLSGPSGVLRALEQGLHSLTVETFAQRLSYDTHAQFLEFLTSVGRDGLWSLAETERNGSGEIRETYRRYAKTLVHFDVIAGRDSRVGLSKEWVQQGDGFTLYANGAPAAGEPVQVICEGAEAYPPDVAQSLRTDRAGKINPMLPVGARCLINTVFVEFDAAADLWHSDWVSLYLLAHARR